MKKTRNFLRLLLSMLLGVIMLFPIQLYLYNSGTIRTNVGRDWVYEEYLKIAVYLLVASCLSTFSWFFLTRRRQRKTDEGLAAGRIWLSLLACLFVVVVVLAFAVNREGSAAPSLLLFFLLDVFLLYWIPTAVGSYGDKSFVPPLSLYIRTLLGDRL